MSTINNFDQIYSMLLVQDDLDRLNVAPKCSDKEINTQFKKLAIQYHPDKNSSFKETACKIFQLILKSRNILLAAPVSSRLHKSQQIEDEKKRKEFEEKIKNIWVEIVLDELKIIDNLSLDKARYELAYNSQSSIPCFNREIALKIHISKLEQKKSRERIHTICSIARWAIICISIYFSAKNNPEAPLHRLIKYLKTKLIHTNELHHQKSS